jgi:hypothetical protein
MGALGALTAVLVACGAGGGGASPDASTAGQASTGSPPGGAAAASVPSPTQEAVNYTGKFSLSPDNGTIGSVVTAKGSGFDANVSLDLVWQAFTGNWKTDGEKFLGREFSEVMQPLTTVRTDGTGSFETQFTVPDGFGFMHDVRVEQDRVLRNKAGFNVQMEVTVSPTSGPAGTPITIEAKGIGWQSLQNSWAVLYDNRYTGYMSAVTTNGYAKVTIPATGSAGKHVISILHASLTFPYMNMQQSPQPDRPTWTVPFTVTKGAPVLPPPATSQGLPRVEASAAPPPSGPWIATDWLNGQVGSPVTLRGRGFTPNDSVELLWYRVVGSRVSGNGWDEQSVSLGKVTVGSDGTFSFPFQTLDDLGGDHRIEAWVKGEKLASTSYEITPSAFALSTSSAPAGTMVTVHLKGGGWTETANIYTVVYDNGYVGYACAFNSQGDLTIYLPATGDPGWHFIDLYPAIYKGKDAAGVDDFRVPQLSFASDHPHEKLPAFHFAIQVTES